MLILDILSFLIKPKPTLNKMENRLCSLYYNITFSNAKLCCIYLNAHKVTCNTLFYIDYMCVTLNKPVK